jgi:hypothetical protein
MRRNFFLKYTRLRFVQICLILPERNAAGLMFERVVPFQPNGIEESEPMFFPLSYLQFNTALICLAEVLNRLA